MTPAERFSILNKFKVPTWPAPNSARIDPAYRWVISTPNCVPRASRYFFTGAPNGIDIGEVGIIDMFPSGGMLMNGQTPINTDGRQVFLECAGFAPPDIGPQGVPGMYVTFLWTRVGFTPTRATYWSILPWLGPPHHDMGPSQTNHNIPELHEWNLQVDQLGENPDFDANWITNFGWKTISACNLDLPGGQPAPLGHAAFNGVDAYISMDHDITVFNQAFVIDVEVRLHSTTDFWCLFGRENAGGFIGMEGPFLIFGALKAFTPFVGELDTWYNWRLEFEQPDQLKIKLFIDDVDMSENIINRLNTPFNNIGVFRHTQPAELWAHIDVRNLKIFNGVAPSTVPQLDMPLTVDALDLSPEENHGTPFNIVF